MKKGKLLLRITFWWGLIADAIETIRMMAPNLMKSTMGLTLPVDNGLQFGLLYGMPVMLGWTLILFWADRRPLERRGLLLCLIPVVVSYIGVELFAISQGWLPVQPMIFPFFSETVLLGLSIVSYFMTGKAEPGENEK